MRRWWRATLSGRLISLTLLSLVAAQLLAVAISLNERGRALGEASRAEFYSRATNMALLLESMPPELRPKIVAASAAVYTRFWFTEAPPGDAEDWRRAAIARLGEPLPNLPRSGGASASTSAEAVVALAADASYPARWQDLAPGAWPLDRAAETMQLGRAGGIGLAVSLSSGGWLNTATSRPPMTPAWEAQSLAPFALAALLLCITAAIAARGITGPLRQLAGAAEAVGRGEWVTPLPEVGTDDIRATAAAFNRMQARLRRFLEDRNRMLAAISHDLRTPLTSLRLRAELVDEGEGRDRILATLDEIEGLSDAMFAYARGEAMQEEMRIVDLTALVESLCDDLAEIGVSVAFEEGQRIDCRCRPAALRRAVRNLIENAARYGISAEVSVARGPKSVLVRIEDRGPGIPDELKEQVFMPFFRIEGSRNRDTGGSGLGLAIARSIIRQHGGDVSLETLAVGLRATVELPAAC